MDNEASMRNERFDQWAVQNTALVKACAESFFGTDGCDAELERELLLMCLEAFQGYDARAGVNFTVIAVQAMRRRMLELQRNRREGKTA